VARKATFLFFIQGKAKSVSSLIADIENVVAPALAVQNVELVDLTYQKEHGGWTLCFYLDKPGGITLDDCARYSDELGVLVEQANLIQGKYVLEVSSPGLERPLKKLKDFERFAGERISVKLFGPLDGQKNFHGILLGADESSIRIQTDEKKEVTLPRSQVAKCRLDPIIKI
jgi:ribosome maturation factor RimP